MQPTGVDPAVAELLHSAVHDLKSPAARLRLLTQLLIRSGAALDEDARMLLKHMEDSAAAVEVVAEGLRNYVEICGRPLEREPLDLGLAVAAAIANLRAEIESTGAQVRAFRSAGGPCRSVSDDLAAPRASGECASFKQLRTAADSHLRNTSRT